MTHLSVVLVTLSEEQPPPSYKDDAVVLNVSLQSLSASWRVDEKVTHPGTEHAALTSHKSSLINVWIHQRWTNSRNFCLRFFCTSLDLGRCVALWKFRGHKHAEQKKFCQIWSVVVLLCSKRSISSFQPQSIHTGQCQPWCFCVITVGLVNTVTLQTCLLYSKWIYQLCVPYVLLYFVVSFLLTTPVFSHVI